MTLTETRTLVTPAGVAGLTSRRRRERQCSRPQTEGRGGGRDRPVDSPGWEAPQTFQQSGCPGFAGPILDIMDKLDPAISVIVSGHTHQAYACRIKRGGTDRLLTSAGRYGNLVTDIRLEFDRSTRALTARSAAQRAGPARTRPGRQHQRAGERYAAAAAPAAARVVGKLSGPALKSETDEEGTAGDLIADAQLAATWPRDRGAADISFINAPGIRSSLIPRPTERSPTARFSPYSRSATISS